MLCAGIEEVPARGDFLACEIEISQRGDAVWPGPPIVIYILLPPYFSVERLRGDNVTVPKFAPLNLNKASNSQFCFVSDLTPGPFFGVRSDKSIFNSGKFLPLEANSYIRLISLGSEMLLLWLIFII